MRSEGDFLLTRGNDFVTLYPPEAFFRPRRVRPMFYQTEAKPQGWRALAIFDDRPEQLLYLHRSSTQIRAGYRTAFFEVLDDEERSHVTGIALQRWQGAPDSGRWITQSHLNLPVAEKLAQSA